MNISVHVVQLTGSKKGRVPLGGAAQSSGFGLNSHFHPLVFILSWFSRCILVLSFSLCLSIYQSVCWLSNSDWANLTLTCDSKMAKQMCQCLEKRFFSFRAVFLFSPSCLNIFKFNSYHSLRPIILVYFSQNPWILWDIHLTKLRSSGYSIFKIWIPWLIFS